MSVEMKPFIALWDSYVSCLPINDYECDKYSKIINKLRNNEIDFSKTEKLNFIELVEIMADIIYNNTNGIDKYPDDYYSSTKIYDEPELNYCSNLLNYLENKIISDSEDAYDKAFTDNILNRK
jgi:hypothetical protein